MADTRSFDIIVIGIGAMGSAACRHLARRGVRVLGLEQFGIPNDLGSSHGESRIVRLCYYEHPDYVPLLKRAYELWDELGREIGSPILDRTGGLFMGRREGAFIQETLRAAELHDLPCQLIDRDRVLRDHPQFVLPDSYVGLHEPNAGYVVPEQVITAQADLALKDGAELHGHEPVIAWSAEGGRVRVETDRDQYEADRLVICGGAWMSGLLTDLELPLTVTRQVMGWVWPKKPELFAHGRFPVWAIEQDDGSLHYGFPILPQRPGLKIAHHFQGEPTNPASINRLPQPSDEDDFRWVLERFLPDADGPLLSMRVCMYTNTPDGHFIIDRHPQHKRVVIAGGLSGHGFKFAPVIGEALADLAENDRTELPIGFLSLDRFRNS